MTLDSVCAGLGVMPPAAALEGLPTFVPEGGLDKVTLPSMGSMSGDRAEPGLSITSRSPAITLSVPHKLVKKILELNFVDMAELLPDSWRMQEEEKGCCHQRRGARRNVVTDILVWVECFSTLVSVLATKYPHKTPQLMAYQQTIIRAHRTFVGEGWLTYDVCFRRKAAIVKSLDWGMVDFTLYNETFTGRAKSIPRCRHCLSEHHQSADCSYAPDLSEVPQSGHRPVHQPSQICQLYNGKHGDRCHFSPCKFRHVCMDCKGSHPVANCRRLGYPPAKRARGRP